MCCCSDHFFEIVLEAVLVSGLLVRAAVLVLFVCEAVFVIV